MVGVQPNFTESDSPEENNDADTASEAFDPQALQKSFNRFDEILKRKKEEEQASIEVKESFVREIERSIQRFDQTIQVSENENPESDSYDEEAVKEADDETDGSDIDSIDEPPPDSYRQVTMPSMGEMTPLNRQLMCSFDGMY